jgi:5-methyltetrahydrofolate--homocysteine methyltransferase
VTSHTEEIHRAILNGNADIVATHVIAALDENMDPQVVLNDGMIAAMKEVGDLFEKGEYFVPEMLVAAKAMQTGLNILKPSLVANAVEVTGKVAIGTVKGDLHDIGKNLVSLMLEGAGFEIIDLGTDVSPEIFINAIKDQSVQIIALSALLTTTMPSMELTITALKEAKLRDSVKVIVGGAPVTEGYAKKIGADGYAPNASRAVKLAESLLIK